MKIIGVYKITNTITGDYYIGSSRDIKSRWVVHKCSSTWKRFPNSPMYLDMKKYGIDKFVFEVLEEVEIARLRETEQKFIETLKPTYNRMNAKGFDFDRHKKYLKEYQQSDKGKKSLRKANNKYNNQLCFFNGETLTLSALYQRFKKRGFEHPKQEAKKYLLVPKKSFLRH